MCFAPRNHYSDSTQGHRYHCLRHKGQRMSALAKNCRASLTPDMEYSIEQGPYGPFHLCCDIPSLKVQGCSGNLSISNAGVKGGHEPFFCSGWGMEALNPQGESSWAVSHIPTMLWGWRQVLEVTEPLRKTMPLYAHCQESNTHSRSIAEGFLHPHHSVLSRFQVDDAN